MVKGAPATTDSATPHSRCVMRRVVLLTVCLLLYALPLLARTADEPMIGIFTDHCRTVFASGEEIEVSVAVHAPRALTGELSLTLSGPRLSLPIFTVPLALPAGGRSTTTCRLRPDLTQLLKPADYTLNAHLGPWQSLPFPLTIPDTSRATHLVIAEANWSGTRDYGRDLSSVPLTIWSQVSLGHNLALDANNSWNNAYPTLKNPFNLREGEHGDAPEEWQADRDFMDYVNEELLRQGIGRVVQVHGLWSHSLRLGRAQNQADYVHSFATATQNWKRYPNFLGVSYGDNLHPLGDWENGAPDAPQSDPNFAERMQAFVAEFSKLHPEFSVTSETLSPGSSRLWRSWMAYIETQFPRASLHWRQALSAQMTNFITTQTADLATLTNYGAGGNPESLTGAMTVLQATGDVAEGTPFAPELSADLLLTARQTQPVWVSGWGSAREGTGTILSQMVSLLGRQVDGVGPFNADEFAMLAKNEDYDSDHFSLARRERNKIAGELCTRYGDLCLNLTPEKDVALLYSATQGIFDISAASWQAGYRTEAFSYNPFTAKLNQRDEVSQAFADLWRAGFTPRLVSEAQIGAGGLEGYQALVIAGVTRTLPTAVLDRLADFQQNGGRIYVDDQTTVTIPDALQLGVSFNRAGFTEWKQAIKALRAPMPATLSPAALQYNAGKANWPVLRQKLQDVVPFAVRTDPHLLCTVQAWGPAHYLFVSHDTPMAGLDATRFRAADTQWLAPITGDVQLAPGAYTIYDLFSQREVPARTVNGRTTLSVDLRSVEGRIYALLPGAIAGVTLAAPDTVSLGGQAPVTVRVLGNDGQALDAAVAVEIQLRDPKGNERRRLFRSANGEHGCQETFTLYGNDEPGVWTLSVKELFSGRWAQKALLVTPRAITLTPRVVMLAPEVTVTNYPALCALCRPSREILIALDVGQEAYHEMALQVATRLHQLGVVSAVVPLNTISAPPTGPGSNLRPERTFTNDLPDVPHHVVVLSGSKSSTLLERLYRHGCCTRPLTPNYPGPGKGIIDYHWSPCTGGYDLISLAGNDDAGLQKAVDCFLGLLDQRIAPEVSECQTLAANLEHVRTGMLPPRIAWQPAPGSRSAEPTTGTQTSRGMITGADPEDFIAKRCGAVVMALATSADGHYLAAGVQNVGPNLSLLDETGKILWTRQCGTLFVDKVAVTNAGEVVAACLVDGRVVVYGRDGALLHTYTVPAVFATSSAPLRYDPFFYVAHENVLLLNERTKIRAMSWGGDVRWEWSAPVGQRAITLSGTPEGSQVVVGCWNPEPLTWHDEEPVGIEKLATVVQLRANDGNVRWTTAGIVADGLWVSPEGKYTVTSGASDLTVLNATGQIIARYPSGHHMRGDITPDGARLVTANAAGRTSQFECDPRVMITDVATGKRQYLRTGDVLGDIVVGRDGAIYTYSWDGLIYQLPVHGPNGALAEVGPGARLLALPSGALVAGNAAGLLSCVLPDGKIRWQVRLPAAGGAP